MLFDFTISSVMVSEIPIEILKAPDYPYSPFNFYMNGFPVSLVPYTVSFVLYQSTFVAFDPGMEARSISAILSNLMIYLVPYSVCCILVLHIDFMCPAKI